MLNDLNWWLCYQQAVAQGPWNYYLVHLVYRGPWDTPAPSCAMRMTMALSEQCQLVVPIKIEWFLSFIQWVLFFQRVSLTGQSTCRVFSSIETNIFFLVYLLFPVFLREYKQQNVFVCWVFTFNIPILENTEVIIGSCCCFSFYFFEFWILR